MDQFEIRPHDVNLDIDILANGRWGKVVGLTRRAHSFVFHLDNGDDFEVDGGGSVTVRN
jgi:hypothetical protein